MRARTGLTVITFTMVASIGVTMLRNTEPSQQTTDILKWLIVSYSFQLIVRTAGGRFAMELGTKLLPVVFAFLKSDTTHNSPKSEVPTDDTPSETGEFKPQLPVAARGPKPARKKNRRRNVKQ